MAFITGMGMITALGNSVTENHQALLQEKHGLTAPEILETLHRNDARVGEIKYTNAQLATTLGLKTHKGYSRTTLLGIYALREALAQIPESVWKNKNIAFINSTTVGGMSDVEELYEDMISEQTSGTFTDYIDSLDCADCTQRIAEYFQLNGYQTTISTACSSAANALLLGARLIAQKEYDMVICGGTDALTRFTLNGFSALKNVDKNLNRPFDANRNGLNLGEAAAYLILESAEAVTYRNASPAAELVGYGNTNEAYHPTAPSPDGAGALRTMAKAIAQAKLQTTAISYINTHGTATQGNDLSEGAAIMQLFPNQQPYISATKSATGHTLAASGAVEAIFSCLSLQHGFVPATLRFETPMSETGLIPQQYVQTNLDLEYALSNSFGFGGSNVSLVLKKV
jgi:3-oxoacyl-(acyl-carrier-protein) synthase